MLQINTQTIPPSGAPPAGESADPLFSRQQVSLRRKIGTLLTIILPLLGVLAAPFLVWGWGFGWVDLWLFVAMYLVTTLGITVGFHRLFVHRSFETHTWVKSVFAAMGSMAVQGSLIQWVGTHRLHHQHSDTHQDPHTPHHHGKGILGAVKGAWHSHLGWFFAPKPDLSRYVKDLTTSRILVMTSNLFPFWVALGLLLPALLGGIISGSWRGALTGLIWGGLIRVFLVHHVTWSVNSACHLWGSRPYISNDMSRDNLMFGILAMGEGWHNTHHAFPTSARHGLKWWQFDASYLVIRMLNAIGLAWNLKLPSATDLQQASYKAAQSLRLGDAPAVPASRKRA